jgi:hypothetical protein
LKQSTNNESRRCEKFEYILLRESLACLVVLHVVVGKNLRQHGEIGTHQRLVPSFMQRQDLLFVILDCHPCSPVERRLAASRPSALRPGSHPAATFSIFHKCVISR